MATNHECRICGTKYYFCPVCHEQFGGTPWKMVACSPECYQVSTILSAYRAKDMTQEQAFDALVNLDYDVNRIISPLLHGLAMEVTGETTPASEGE